MPEIPLKTSLTPEEMFHSFYQECENAFLLESAEGPEKLERYSFIGFNPKKKVTHKGSYVETNGKRKKTLNPFDALKKQIDIGKMGLDAEGFIGGAVGYFAFDFASRFEEIYMALPDDPGFPDFEFGIYEDALAYDHRKKRTKYVYTKENRIEEIRKIMEKPLKQHAPLNIKSIKCNTSRDEFCKKVKAAKEHIVSGDIFQVVLSKRYDIEFEGSLMRFYSNLKKINPSPYMYCIKFGERQIVGASPENLIRIENGKITSFATLAGTRPRGTNAEEDKKLEKELLNDEKECAEHRMLVDLTRNDVGKVSTPGTVKVPELMAIHKFSHVQHIASQVTGDLAEGKSCFDAFKAIFPAGTVSGAPKIRAIEIINRLERERRGPYAGAVGYFSKNGNADFAIGIRTLFANGKTAYIQTGAGIVYDSDPEKEFEETEKKAMALLLAIGDE